jgi:hypothetical protein
MQTDAKKIASGGKWGILVRSRKAKRKFRLDGRRSGFLAKLGDVVMRVARILPAFLLLFSVFFNACKGRTQVGTQGPAPFTVLPAAQGEIIEYGGAAGANSLAAAMGNVLSQIHQACGEKPAVGQVFRVKGSNSSGVFFTVVDHAQANRQLAGLVIAAQIGSHQFEVGVVSDSADRFAQTANPMMQQLFSAWNPGASSAASVAGGSASVAGSSSAAGAVPASSVPLHPVTAPDNSATISVPDGWTLDPASNMGQLSLHGANGEQMGLMMSKGAADPSNPWQMRMAAGHYSVILPGSVVYAFRGDPVKEFVPLFQAWRKVIGKGPAQIVVQNAQSMPTSPGNHCAGASGQMDPDGKGMQSFTSEICANDPNPQYGTYAVTLTHILVPLSIGDTEKGLINAIIGSYKPNQHVISQEANQLLKAKQQSDQQTLAVSHAIVNQINQVGAQATARYNATQAANDAQHAGYWAQQNSNARSSAGFSNYLLDQSVVQNNSVGGTGAVGHATVWNSTANAMVQANPNKYEIVDTPNYWQGVDY